MMRPLFSSTLSRVNMSTKIRKGDCTTHHTAKTDRDYERVYDAQKKKDISTPSNKAYRPLVTENDD